MLTNIRPNIASFFEKYPASQYFLAVSGGQDSMLLLDLCRKQSLPIKVLHVNYQLRGDESNGDQAFVEAYCQTHAVPIDVHRVDLKEKLTSGGNLQQLARKERYEFFERHLNQVPNSYLLVAHHQDDQLETFWLQLFRGAGMSGLQGMLEKNGRVLRPLLPFSKKELTQLSVELMLRWREDSSNQSTKYLRNLFRLKLIPELEQEIPTLRHSIQTIQGVFQSTLLENNAEIEALTEGIRQNKSITLNELNHIPDFKLVEVLKNLSIPAVFAKKIPILLHGEAGKQLSWKANDGPFQSIVKERDSLCFVSTNPSTRFTPTFHAELITELPSEFDKKTLFLDQSKVLGELFIRPWTNGDRMHPIGLSGSKLISDILKDDGVRTSEKQEKFVLCDEEKIICCIGHRIDRRSIATKESKLIIQVDIQQ